MVLTNWIVRGAAGLLSLLVACGINTAQTSQSVLVPACQDPVSFGAVPNDELSDRAAIQSAISVATSGPDGGTVCIGAGRWTLEKPPINSYNRFAALSTHSPNPLVIKGAGPETVLQLSGDQGAETTIVISIDPGAQHVRVEDLTIDTTDATNTDEQTHAIGTSGVCSDATCLPIKDIKVENVRFKHPRNTEARKGDCIRLLGNEPATEVYDVRIVGNHFEDCARSAIELQRGLHGVVIADNTIYCESCDQQIDGEATGGGWDFGVVISNNTITSGPNVQGDFAIALTSVDGASVSGNQLDRGLALYRTQRVVISSNVIKTVATETDDGGTIRLRNICNGNIVANNTINRAGTPGPLVSVEYQVNACVGATISGNILVQGTPRWAVYGSSFSDGVISSNIIEHVVPAPGYSSIYNRALIPVTGLVISNNAIKGDVAHAVRLQAHPSTIGSGVVLTGNTAIGPPVGLFCEDGGFIAPITSSGNAWGPANLGSAAIQPGN